MRALLVLLFALTASAAFAHATTKPALPVAQRPVAPMTTTPRPVAPMPAAPAMTESMKIEALIAGIEHLPNAVFIRNGSEYDGKKAASHLRRKWNYAGKRITTAEQFIDYLATASSFSGRKYKIRFADGRTVDSEAYFHEQLRLLEARGRPAVAKRP